MEVLFCLKVLKRYFRGGPKGSYIPMTFFSLIWSPIQGKKNTLSRCTKKIDHGIEKQMEHKNNAT